MVLKKLGCFLFVIFPVHDHCGVSFVRFCDDDLRIALQGCEGLFFFTGDVVRRGFRFPQNVTDSSTSSVSLNFITMVRKAGSTPAMMSLTGTRFGTGAKFRPRSRTAFSESLSLCEERMTTQFLSRSGVFRIVLLRSSMAAAIWTMIECFQLLPTSRDVFFRWDTNVASPSLRDM